MEIALWALIVFIFLLLLFSRPYRQWKEYKYSEFMRRARQKKKEEEQKEKVSGKISAEKEEESSTGVK